MSLKLSISLFFLFLIFILGYSKVNNSNKTLRYYLVGTWLSEGKTFDGDMVFKRKIGNKITKGSQIEISNNGTIQRKHRNAKRCGNDSRGASVGRGKWSLNGETLLVNTHIISSYNKYKIIELNIRRMVLSEINTE